MSEMIEDLVICSAFRTPFSFGNHLQKYQAKDLLEVIYRGILNDTKIDPKEITGIIAGCVQQDTKAPNVARLASLRAGMPDILTDFSVQNNCNSGFVGLKTAIGEIASGAGDVYIASGVESMSNYGYRLHAKTNNYGSALDIENKIKESGDAFLQDFDIKECLNEGLTDPENNMPMIEVAEIMANKFGISRDEQDKYTFDNLKRAVDAIEGDKLQKFLLPLGDFKKDNYPINRKRLLKSIDTFKKAALIFANDSQVLTAADFYKKHEKHLKKLGISKIDPTVTMYTSCIPGDGASGCLITTEKRAKELGLKPLLRVINFAVAGVNPVIMGIGPMESTHKIFTKPLTKRAAKVKFQDVDVIEIHEAFAAQVLSVFKESKKLYNYNFDLSKVNNYGGSLAYTHPLAATNFRLLTNILSRFEEDKNARFALAASCAGGGQGTSFLFQRYE